MVLSVTHVGAIDVRDAAVLHDGAPGLVCTIFCCGTGIAVAKRGNRGWRDRYLRVTKPDRKGIPQ